MIILLVKFMTELNILSDFLSNLLPKLPENHKYIFITKNFQEEEQELIGFYPIGSDFGYCNNLCNHPKLETISLDSIKLTKVSY